MKRIFRTLVFSGIALYLTSLWNHGLQLRNKPIIFIEFAILFAIVTLFLRPLLKSIVLPINLFTFGLSGFILNLLLFYLIFTFFPELKITGWTFPGVDLSVLKIKSFYLNQTINFFVVIFSISFIISLLETFL